MNPLAATDRLVLGLISRPEKSLIRKLLGTGYAENAWKVIEQETIQLIVNWIWQAVL